MVAPAEYKALPRTRNRAHGFRRSEAAASLRRARNRRRSRGRAREE
ncbi:MAG TPA: 50S ribosomal protein L34 [Rhodanobacteraceae bacterium]|nr:50S ribosomal protein L34 [Rhodanobacteraceae bacterium]